MSTGNLFTIPHPHVAREIPVPADGVEQYYFYGKRRLADGNPQAFLATYEPNRQARAHFHHVDQFQIFFGTPGSTFRRQDMDALMVHYTDADTLYGPFAAGDVGLHFLTLRRQGSESINFMPENRDDMHSPPTRRRHKEIGLGQWLGAELPPPTESVTSDVFEKQADGLVAFKIAAGPGATFQSPPANGGGQYHIVVWGSVLDGTEVLSDFSVGWVEPNGEVATYSAGPKGTQMLVLQFGIDP